MGRFERAGCGPLRHGCSSTVALWHERLRRHDAFRRHDALGRHDAFGPFSATHDYPDAQVLSPTCAALAACRTSLTCVRTVCVPSTSGGLTSGPGQVAHELHMLQTLTHAGYVHFGWRGCVSHHTGGQHLDNVLCKHDVLTSCKENWPSTDAKYVCLGSVLSSLSILHLDACNSCSGTPWSVEIRCLWDFNLSGHESLLT